MPLPVIRADWVGRTLTLGGRPEHIKLSSQHTGGLPLVVETLERPGADNLAHGRWSDNRMVVRLPHVECPDPGGTLWLHLPTDARHFFDTQNGQRLE
ncbi:TOBE domain-containing protein [Erwinia tracheiphila]|uniref:TOBE domain-containing protein n=2 Tax=Erwinia tracheiphila TaxID=65700 RepID=A0A345CYR5_9GAMM|nr:TOBE domain-containing protein [Erwinia tracheiphila]